MIAATQLKHSEYQKERKLQAQETEIRGTQKEVCSIKSYRIWETIAGGKEEKI
mgnify:CR=1 FL=1